MCLGIDEQYLTSNAKISAQAMHLSQPGGSEPCVSLPLLPTRCSACVLCFFPSNAALSSAASSRAFVAKAGSPPPHPASSAPPLYGATHRSLCTWPQQDPAMQ